MNDLIPLSDDNPHDITPLLTWAFFIINVLIFIFSINATDQGIQNLYQAFALIPAELFGKVDPNGGPPEKITLLTSALLHGDIFHLIFNMLFWIIFADNIEYAFGKIRFLLFCIASAAVSAGAQAYLDPSSTIPMIGFSGVISAVMGAYVVLYPHAKINIINPNYSFLWSAYSSLFAFTIAIPAWLCMGIWFSRDIIGFITIEKAPQAGGIAFAAHIAGFAFGLALGRILRINMSLYELKAMRKKRH